MCWLASVPQRVTGTHWALFSTFQDAENRLIWKPQCGYTTLPNKDQNMKAEADVCRSWIMTSPETTCHFSENCEKKKKKWTVWNEDRSYCGLYEISVWLCDIYLLKGIWTDSEKQLNDITSWFCQSIDLIYKEVDNVSLDDIRILLLCG